MAIEDYCSDKKNLALLLLVKDEVNKVRKELSLPEYTDEEAKEAFKNKLNELGQVCEHSEE